MSLVLSSLHTHTSRYPIRVEHPIVLELPYLSLSCHHAALGLLVQRAVVLHLQQAATAERVSVSKYHKSCRH